MGCETRCKRWGLEGLEARRLLAGVPSFVVDVRGAVGSLAPYLELVRSTVLAAANDWGRHIDSSASIEIEVTLDSSLASPTIATGGYRESAFFREGIGYTVEQSPVARELATGVDANGTAADAVMRIRTGVLGELFFDTSSGATESVPPDKLDARTTFRHEFAHMLGMIGTRNDPPAGDRTTYNQYIGRSGGELVFSGPNALAVHGVAVPLMEEDTSHVEGGGPGADLTNDLLSSTVAYGTRKAVSPVDLAMAADVGVPLKAPPAPAVRASDARRSVGSSPSSVDFVLTLTKAPTTTVTVPVNTVNGTAVAGVDFTAVNTSLAFAPGEMRKVLSVPAQRRAGATTGQERSFTLNFGLPTGASLLVGQAEGTVVAAAVDPPPPVNPPVEPPPVEPPVEPPPVEPPTEPPPTAQPIIPLVSVTPAGPAVAGVNPTLDFVVTLSQPAGTEVRVTASTADGDAVAGVDYTPVNAVLTFAPGETSKVVSVPVLGGSGSPGARSLALNLSAPENVTLGTAQATGQISGSATTVTAKRRGTFTDGGNIVTVSLKGPGTATVLREDSGGIRGIAVSGSTQATTLSVRGPATIRSIDAPGGLSSIDAVGSSLAGSVTVGGVGKVRFLDVLAGSTLSLGAGRRPTVLTAGSITDSTLSAGPLGNMTVGTLRGSTVRVTGRVGAVKLGSVFSSRLLIGTDAWADSPDDFTNPAATLRSITVKGTFADTRIAAPTIGTARLGSVQVDNGSNEFGLAARSSGAVLASTPAEPRFRRGKMTTAQVVREGDFTVRMV